MTARLHQVWIVINDAHLSKHSDLLYKIQCYVEAHIIELEKLYPKFDEDLANEIFGG